MDKTYGSIHYLEDTNWEIRKQILDYETTRYMSDIERAIYFGLPNGCRIRENAKIISPENLTIGEYCWIGEGAVLDASGKLEIGDNTTIGLSVFVWTHDSSNVNLTGTNNRENSYKIKRKPTKIGSHCFIAGHSVIMPGVSIGDYCIIAPMSVVYKDLPNGSIFTPYMNFARLENKVKLLRERVHSLEEELKNR